MPENIKNQVKGKLIQLRYINEKATTPILHEMANKYQVLLNILHGQIEYFNDKALGNLMVKCLGESENIKSLIKALKDNQIITEEIQ